MAELRPIVPNFVVQEEGSRKVLVYLNIPELKVKRSFPNFTKQIPMNGEQKILNFQNQSFTFTLNVQTKNNEIKIYSLSIARLPGEIQSERCSIKYQRGGCWITLIKLDRISWMNRICDDLSPGLDIQENYNQNTEVSAPVEEKQLRDTNMPPPFSLVPIAPSPSFQPPTTLNTQT
ncbi:unnamed protein product [Rotaria sp. Silwood2]|nr:unnamed protein product [Rotaria sp. Silwood2]CAF2759397.1 unnamed protein product [Rotaria sp. Silwood2]CAF3169659.1 unnamed protein product [Rotaria sp. Silwood2]CAF4521694.1 unnamed protein product [Rotaria sp. Silwood2]